MADGFEYSEKKCRRCGKKFITHGEWAYSKGDKQHIRYWCSWSCMRADESVQGNRAERRKRIQQAISDGLTTSEIVSLLHEDRKLVTYLQEKMGVEDGRARETENP